MRRRPHLSEHIARLKPGDRIILCRRNRPVAEIRPLQGTVGWNTRQALGDGSLDATFPGHPVGLGQGARRRSPGLILRPGSPPTKRCSISSSAARTVRLSREGICQASDTGAFGARVPTRGVRGVRWPGRRRCHAQVDSASTSAASREQRVPRRDRRPGYRLIRCGFLMWCTPPVGVGVSHHRRLVRAQWRPREARGDSCDASSTADAHGGNAGAVPGLEVEKTRRWIGTFAEPRSRPPETFDLGLQPTRGSSPDSCARTGSTTRRHMAAGRQRCRTPRTAICVRQRLPRCARDRTWASPSSLPIASSGTSPSPIARRSGRGSAQRDAQPATSRPQQTRKQISLGLTEPTPSCDARPAADPGSTHWVDAPTSCRSVRRDRIQASSAAPRGLGMTPRPDQPDRSTSPAEPSRERSQTRYPRRDSTAVVSGWTPAGGPRPTAAAAVAATTPAACSPRSTRPTSPSGSRARPGTRRRGAPGSRLSAPRVRAAARVSRAAGPAPRSQREAPRVARRRPHDDAACVLAHPGGGEQRAEGHTGPVLRRVPAAANVARAVQRRASFRCREMLDVLVADVGFGSRGVRTSPPTASRHDSRLRCWRWSPSQFVTGWRGQPATSCQVRLALPRANR